MDAVLHVPNWQEHGALLSVCPVDKTCSQLPSAFTLRIYTYTACPCIYRYGHKAGVHYPQCASHKAGMWDLHPSVNTHAEHTKNRPARAAGR